MLLSLTLCIIIVGIYWLWNHRRVNKNEPPHLPGSWPILGHIPLLYGDAGHIWKVVDDISRHTNKLGGVATFFIGPRTTYVLTDPDDVQTVANTCLAKDGFYDFIKPWFGEGLLTGKVPIWKLHRKLIQPAFNQALLDSYIGIFNMQSRKLAKEFEGKIGKGPFDPIHAIRPNSLETICMTAMGVDTTNEKLKKHYEEAFDLFVSSLIDRFTKFWLHSPFIFQFSALKKRQEDYLKTLHNMSLTVLYKRKSILKKNYADFGAYSEPGTTTKFISFLDLLLKLSMEKGVITDTEIREEVDTMIAAGHDTVVVTLTFTLILLGTYPEVQTKVIQELQEVFGDLDRDVEKPDLSRLVYLEAVLKESMRLYSTGPVILRWIDRDVKLKNCTLSAGRTCCISIIGIHRHPVWGPDADQFKPERWLDPGQLPDNPNAFAAFMVGRRMCIGMTYAYMAMKIYMVHLLRRYRFTGDRDKMKLKYEVVLMPESGHHISIEKRG